MKPRPLIPLLTVIFLLGGIFSPLAAAKTAGNCLECHSAKFAFDDVTNFYRAADIEKRNAYQARLNPCPGIRALTEETYYTESRLTQLNRMAASLDREGTAAALWRAKVAETGEAFSAMKETGVSGAQFAKSAAFLRTGLQKVYDPAFQARAETKYRWMIGAGAILLVLFLVFAGIGYRRLNRFSRNVLLLGLVLGSFSLNACSRNGAEPKTKSPAQDRVDQAQAVATKLLAKTEDSFSAAILLAGLAQDWAKLDPVNAEKAFQLSWGMALKGREGGGEIAPLKQIAQQWPNPAEAVRQRVDFDAVLNLREDLKSLENRAWALRAIGEEWYKANPKKGREALESAYREARGIQNGEIRDIELKALGEAWAGIDRQRALEIVGSIQEPFLRAMALAGVARTTQEKEKAGELLQASWKMAESVSPDVLRIYALSKISAIAAGSLPQQRGEWAGKVHAKMKELKDPLVQVYACQEMVSSWASKDWEQAERWADEIPANQAEARTFSLIQVGGSKNLPEIKALALLRKAMAEADRIEDPFQTQKAKTLILLGLAPLDLQAALEKAPQIEDPILRSELESQIVGRIGAGDPDRALKIAENIPDSFGRWKSILRILNQKLPREVDQLAAIYREALQAGAGISDPYTRALFLAELGKNWGRIDKPREGAAYDLALKSAGEISSPSLRTEVLEALAGNWKNTDKTKADSLIGGLDTHVLRARRAVEEVKLWSKIDSEKARQMAEAIPVAFANERAQAFKEVAVVIKKSRPDQSRDLLEKAWQLFVTAPGGGSRDKNLSSILCEMASFNLDKAFALAQTISDRRIREAMLVEAGNALLKEGNPAVISGAMRIGKEIAEGSARASLYQRIADLASKGGKGIDPNQPATNALSQWGQGREAAKKEETKALPYFEAAFQEIGKISDPKEGSFILSGLIGDWAQIDEGRAIKAAEKISPDFPEPFSYSLLQVSIQLRKWNRKDAEATFQRSLTAADSIQDSTLRRQRVIQIAQQWQLINSDKGREILKKAAASPDNPGEWAKSRLDLGKAFYKETIERDLKLLEKARQFSQGNKNPRVLTDVALAWSWIDGGKAEEILALIDSREARVKALRVLARQAGKSKPEVARVFLEKAAQEAVAIEILKEKIPALHEIAADWATIDPGKAKANYLLAYRAAERVDQISPSR